MHTCDSKPPESAGLIGPIHCSFYGMQWNKKLLKQSLKFYEKYIVSFSVKQIVDTAAEA